MNLEMEKQEFDNLDTGNRMGIIFFIMKKSISKGKLGERLCNICKDGYQEKFCLLCKAARTDMSILHNQIDYINN